MEKILLNSTSRRLKLLELLNNAGHHGDVNEFAKKLGCSPQTVLTDCEYFENGWPDYLTIDFSRKRGLHLQMMKNHPISDLYKDVMKDSLTFSLGETIFFHPGMSSDFYSQKLFVSESSLYRLFRALNHVLEERDILLTQTSYVMTSTNELQIRYFFILYFMEINKPRDWPFFLDKLKLIELVDIIKKDFKLKMNFSISNYFLYAIAITLIREQQGFKIDSSLINKHLSINPIKPLANLDLFLEENFPKIDRDSFYLSVFWWDYIWSNHQEKENVQILAQHFIELLTSSFKIEMCAKDQKEITKWLVHIYARHNFYPYKKYICYNHYRYITITIKKRYPYYTKKVVESLKILEDKSHFPWESIYLNEILHKILFLWKNLLASLDELRPKISIAVSSKSGQDHAETLAYLLQKRFHDQIEITSSNDTLTFTDKINYDLCVSNHTIDWIKDEDLIIVNDIPSNKNWLDLATIINEKRQLH